MSAAQDRELSLSSERAGTIRHLYHAPDRHRLGFAVCGTSNLIWAFTAFPHGWAHVVWLVVGSLGAFNLALELLRRALKASSYA